MDEKTFTKIIADKNIVDFLKTNNVYINQDEFVSVITSKNKLPRVLQAHQLSLDYKWSVVSKIVALKKLKNEFSFSSGVAWSDIDRIKKHKTGEKGVVNFHFPLSYDKQGVQLIPDAARISEIRFSQIQQNKFDCAILALRQKFSSSSSSEEKINMLVKFYELSKGNLSAFNKLVSSELIKFYLHENLDEVMVHDVFTKKRDIISEIINNYMAYNETFNSEIAHLNRLIPEFIMSPKNEHELPFYLTCRDDFYRNRLMAKKMKGNILGCTVCTQCGKEMVFDITNCATEDLYYLSPDVSLFLYLADEFDGFVGGISSSIYIIILNKILQLFNLPIKPTLVPQSLFEKPEAFQLCDSLFYYYMTTENE